MSEIIIKCIAGTISTLGFAILFRTRLKLLPLAVADGLVSCIVYFLCISLFGGDFLPNALAAFAAAALAEIFARIGKAPSTVFLLPGCIPLVPGGTLYYSMSCLIAQNYSGAGQYLITTLKVGIGIGAGIIASSLIRYIINLAASAKKNTAK